ncbi:MAG: putative acyl-CoA dehydrogenase [Acidimicrobiia bacterium]|nr:putative acyl-CoA dehydrogenase [Acidimicrobiia bacterium]
MADQEATEATALRAEVNDWLDANWSEALTVRQWWQRLAEAGWAQPTWPRGLGGRAMRSAPARVVMDVLATRGVVGPPLGHVGVSLAAPTLLAHATAEQQQELLPRIARGEDAWCQLFSEPGSGSDLASLSCRATRDDGGWWVSGQKVWNSAADIARRGMLLARTNVDVPKREGISYFLLDMDQPGVDVRPLRQMNGASEFCEVFLDHVWVSDNQVLGQVDRGWLVTATTLAFERASVASRAARGLRVVPSGEKAGFLDRPISEVLATTTGRRRTINGYAVPARRLIELARQRGSSSDPVVRQRLASYYSQTEVNRLTLLRSRAAAAQGRSPGPEGSLTKLAIANICRTSRSLSLDLLRADALLQGSDAPLDGEFQLVALGSFAASIGGGTDEIQRNIIAERALGLPREPEADRGLPYRDLRVGTQAR